MANLTAFSLLCFSCRSLVTLTALGSVDTEKKPRHFRLFGSGSDFSEQIVVFLIAETAFQDSGSGHTKGTTQGIGLLFVRPLPALWDKVVSDAVFPTPFTVAVGGIDTVGGNLLYRAEHMLMSNDRLFQAIALVKRLKINVFYKIAPPTCSIFTFAPNSTDLFSLLLTKGRRQGLYRLTMLAFGSDLGEVYSFPASHNSVTNRHFRVFSRNIFHFTTIKGG